MRFHEVVKANWVNINTFFHSAEGEVKEYGKVRRGNLGKFGETWNASPYTPISTTLLFAGETDSDLLRTLIISSNLFSFSFSVVSKEHLKIFRGLAKEGVSLHKARQA